MTAVVSTQIELDPRGVAWIAGSGIKVIHVVSAKTAQGWSPEEIQVQYPHLSLAQIHGALAYYYKNEVLVDDQIASSQEASLALRLIPNFVSG